jgi:aerobic-type carbon monoxide dehydrogenase small subunit (CoxS/CutS family)
MTHRPPPDDDARPRGLTRRRLFKSAGLAAATSALSGPVRAFAQEATDAPTALGPGTTKVRTTINGAKRTLDVEPRRTLLGALRTDEGLTGCKRVCDRGTCGACTVWLDGLPVYACTILAVETEGRAVTTIEGLGSVAEPHPVQRAFMEHDALQCGFCTPGLVMSCAWAVDTHGKALDEERLIAATAGNLCRCGTYPHVKQAALGAARAGGR